MTKEEFFAELEQTKAAIDWWLERSGAIRGSLKGSGMYSFCPITAVAFEISRCHYYSGNAFDVGPAIGLRKDTTGRIISSADFVDAALTPADSRLRRDLLFATGLTEPSS